VHLGEARSGKVFNAHAHEPVVSEAEFEAAQRQRTVLKPRSGPVAADAMLDGLMRCAGCGHTLKISGPPDRKTGTRVPHYYCIGRYGKGLCLERASARARIADQFVEEQLLHAPSAETGLVAQAVAASNELEQARRFVEQAEHELDQYLAEPLLLTTVGRKRFLDGAQARRLALEEALAAFEALRGKSELTSGDLLSSWDSLTVQEKRPLLHGLLDQVVLSRSEGRGRAATPIAERTKIVLRGGRLLDSARPGAARRQVAQRRSRPKARPA
jgi:recombinase-like zinc beta ribbon protein